MAHTNYGPVITDKRPTIVISADFIRATVHYAENRQPTARTVSNIQISHSLHSTNVAGMSYLSPKYSSEWNILPVEVVERNETHTGYSVDLFRVTVFEIN
jgi:hypothetical protein